MKQRGGYHTLTDEREKRLVEVGFVFNTKESNTLRDIIMRSYSANWNGYLERLVKFKKKHGHCRVPRRHPEDQSLASWVMRQVRTGAVDSTHSMSNNSHTDAHSVTITGR